MAGPNKPAAGFVPASAAIRRLALLSRRGDNSPEHQPSGCRRPRLA